MQRKTSLIAAVLLACAVAVAQSGMDKPAPLYQGGGQQITNGPVAERVTDSSATLGWSVRDGSGNMNIQYGTDRAHLDQTAEAVAGGDGRNFHARLHGLSAETRYYFQVVRGNQPVGGVGTFRTVASGAAPVESKAIIPQ